MTTKTADRIKESASFSGTTTPILLTGPVSGFVSFASAASAGIITSGQNVTYCILDNATLQWEVGEGIFTIPVTLNRTTIYGSSNSNTIVNFSPGGKTVFITLPAKYINDWIVGTLRSGITLPTITISSSYPVGLSDYSIRCNCIGGDVIVTLPDATIIPGKLYNIKKVDVTPNATIIITTSSQTIDGDTTLSTSIPYSSVTLQSNGTSWDIL